jgi:hypothetical protein
VRHTGRRRRTRVGATERREAPEPCFARGSAPERGRLATTDGLRCGGGFVGSLDVATARVPRARLRSTGRLAGDPPVPSSR